MIILSKPSDIRPAVVIGPRPLTSQKHKQIRFARNEITRLPRQQQQQVTHDNPQAELRHRFRSKRSSKKSIPI